MGASAVWQGMNDRAGVIENVRAEVGQEVQLTPAVGQVFEKDRHVVIGILARVAARTRAEQHNTLEPVAIERVEGGAEADQHGIVGRSERHGAFSFLDAQFTTARFPLNPEGVASAEISDCKIAIFLLYRCPVAAIRITAEAPRWRRYSFKSRAGNPAAMAGILPRAWFNSQ